VRDVQITGGLAGSGAIYVAGMDEGGGGFPHNDTNLIFKSTGGTRAGDSLLRSTICSPGLCAARYWQ
jgi:hypothetical protein